MTQTAVVTKIKAPGICEVRIRRSSACSGDCRACGDVCLSPDAIIVVLARNAAGAKPGDKVLVESSSGGVLGLAALVYMLPLLLFMAGWFIHPAIGAAALLVGLGFCFWVNRTLQKKGGLAVRVVTVLPDDWEGFAL